MAADRCGPTRRFVYRAAAPIGIGATASEAWPRARCTETIVAWKSAIGS